MDGTPMHASEWRNPRVVALFTGMVLLAVVVIVSIVRDRIVNQPQWQVSVVGQGKVAYQADIGIITFGVQIDRAVSAEAALRLLNERVTKLVTAIKGIEIPAEDIQTQSYTLYPQYDYFEGTSVLVGYGANQQLMVKVRSLGADGGKLTQVIGAAGRATANQILGLAFDVSNLNELKQEARLKAIEDAKSKAGALAQAVGVELDDVVGWWENVVQAPGVVSPGYGGLGGEKGGAMPVPQTPTGMQEVIVEVNLNYRLD